MVQYENALQGSCQTWPQSGVSDARQKSSVRRDRRWSDQCWSERSPRGQRVLDGLPGARVGGLL